MRHQYTPIFRDVLASRIWAAPPATRAVWLWFQLAADPEGFVCATVSGVAIGAHVSESEARAALELLESPDTDCDAGDPNEGRIIVKVPRGWLVLGFELDRERAKEESRKARNRRYMQRVRAERKAANDAPTPAAPEDTSSHNPGDVSPPKPKPKPKPFSSEGESPQPPVVFVEPHHDERLSPDPYFDHLVRTATLPAPVPAVIHQIPPDWFLSPELLEEARMAGVKDPSARFAELKRGPIGGQRGIFASELTDYVRAQFGKWRTWEETDRAKVNPGVVDTPTAPKVKGMPPWVRESHVTFAQMNKLDLREQAKAFVASHHIPVRTLKPVDAAEAFTHFLLRRCTEAA